MTRRKKAPPPKRVWRPLLPATKIPPTQEKVDAIRAQAEKMGLDPDVAEGYVREPAEMWQNDRFTVVVQRRQDGSVVSLSVRRADRKPDIGWRDLQRIKSQLAGDETEGFELFPAESRLVDTANQRWLWCMPPGEMLPVGFHGGRHVSGPEDAESVGAKQAPFEDEAE